MAVSHLVTKDNFYKVVEELTYASKKTNAYNKDCFGMSDLRLAMRMDKLLGTFIQRVKEGNYCPYALMNTTMLKHGMWIKEEAKNMSLKQMLDDKLIIDMKDYALDMDYAETLFQLYHTKQI